MSALSPPVIDRLILELNGLVEELAAKNEIEKLFQLYMEVREILGSTGLSSKQTKLLKDISEKTKRLVQSSDAVEQSDPEDQDDNELDDSSAPSPSQSEMDLARAKVANLIRFFSKEKGICIADDEQKQKPAEKPKETNNEQSPTVDVKDSKVNEKGSTEGNSETNVKETWNDESPVASTKPHGRAEDEFMEEVRSFASASCTESRLDLRDYELDPHACRTLLHILSTIPRLKSLKLNSSDIQLMGVKSIIELSRKVGMEALCLRSISEMGSYESESTNIKGLDDQCARVIASYLRELDNKLEALNLANNSITSVGITALSECIATNSTLKRLNLDDNPISTTGLKALATALQRNRGITHLSVMTSEKVTADTMVSFLETLFLHNRSLQHLKFRTKNAPNSKQVQKMAEILKSSGSLTKFTLICGSAPLAEGLRKPIDASLEYNSNYVSNPVSGLHVIPQSSFMPEVVRLDLSHFEWENLSCDHGWSKLTELNAGFNFLNSINPRISTLVHLTHLYLNNNLITAVCPEIGQLSNLQLLDLSNNQLSKIPNEMGQLVNLNALVLHHNLIESIPSFKALTNFTSLDLGFNNFSDFPSLSCPRLRFLNLESNSLSIIPPSVSLLVDLEHLRVTANQLNFLPMELNKLAKLEKFDFDLNPLATIPISILDRGKTAVFSYLQELERGSEMYNVVKILVVGSNSGKTTFLENLYGKQQQGGTLFKARKKSTVKKLEAAQVTATKTRVCKLDMHDWNHDNITFRTWDFSGNETLVYVTHQFFVSEQSIFLVVFSMEEGISSVDFWLEAIASRNIDCPIVVLGTLETDNSLSEAEVSGIFERLQAKYSSHFKQVYYCAFVNSRARKNVKTVKAMLAQIAQHNNMVGQRCPSTYLLLSQLLEREKSTSSTENPILKWTDLVEVAAELKLSSSSLREAVKFLHKIGTITHFPDEQQPLINDNIFLSPQWILDRFSQVFTAREMIIKDGRVQHSDLELLWRKDSFQVLLCLMQKFDVLFQVPSRTGKPESIVPSLLPSERPDRVKEIWPPFEDNVQEICRIWEFSFLPLGFFPRLISRTCHLPLVSVECVWKSGILIVYGERSKCLIEYNHSLFSLKVKMRATKESGNFVSMLIDCVNVFIAGWYRDKVKHVRLPCVHCINERSFDPFMFSLDDLELCAARGKRYALCRGIRPVRIDLLAPDIAMADVQHLNREEIVMGKSLGEGSFATVYRATYQGVDVAVKVIKMDSGCGSGDVGAEEQQSDELIREKYNEFRKEVSLMSGLDNPFLVELKGLCIGQKEMLMVTEFAPFGDLYNFLHDESNGIDWPLRIKMAMDVANGMNFLHTTTPPIIHRDLKTPNILLVGNRSSAKVVAKVADFGLSSTLVQTVAGRDVFNPTWLAPEVMVRGAEYTEKADVYSYGIILWELLSRQLPFDEFNFAFSSQLEDEIVSRNLRPTIPADTPSHYAQLIKMCWAAKPEERPTFVKILELLERMRPILAPLIRVTQSYDSGLVYSSDDGTEQRISSRFRNSSLVDETTTAAMSSVLNIKHMILAPNHGGSVKCMLAVDSHVWVGCGNGSIAVWSSTSRQLLQTFQDHVNESGQCAVNALCLVSPDTLWISCQDQTISVWNAPKMKLIKKVKANVIYSSLLSVGKHVWCTNVTEPYSVHIRRKVNYRTKKTLSTGNSPGEGMVRVGDFVWVGSFQCILVYSIEDFSKTATISAHSGMIHNLISVNDHIWSCSSDKTIKVWSADGKCLQTLEGHGSRVFQLLYHKNFVWSASWDKTVMLWNPETLSFVQEVKDIHDDAISAIVRISDTEVWSGSWDKCLCSLYVNESPPPKKNKSGRRTSAPNTLSQSKRKGGSRRSRKSTLRQEIAEEASPEEMVSRSKSEIAKVTSRNSLERTSEDSSESTKVHKTLSSESPTKPPANKEGQEAEPTIQSLLAQLNEDIGSTATENTSVVQEEESNESNYSHHRKVRSTEYSTAPSHMPNHLGSPQEIRSAPPSDSFTNLRKLEHVKETSDSKESSLDTESDERSKSRESEASTKDSECVQKMKDNKEENRKKSLASFIRGGSKSLTKKK